MTTTVCNTLKLRKINPKNKNESMAWEVLDKKETFRYGIVVKQYNEYFYMKLAWRSVKRHFWIFYTIDGDYILGKTRLQALKPLIDNLGRLTNVSK